MGQSKYVPYFIRRYLEFVEDTEPHILHHKWVAISLVSAVCGGKVWVWRGRDKVPLLQFIMLSGPSGTRKTTAIDLGYNLVRPLRIVKFSSDSITRESLMIELAESKVKRRVAGLDEEFHFSELTAVAPDFFAYFRRGDRDFLPWLVRIHDYRFRGYEEEFIYSTKGAGTCVITCPSLTFIGATTPQGLGEAVPTSVIGSGFTARIHFVYAPCKGKSVSYTQTDSKLPDLELELQGALNAMHARSGEISLMLDAAKFYDNYYQTLKQPKDLHPTIVSWYDRFPEHVMRLAGISCVADCRKVCMIEVKDFEWAIRTLEEMMSGMHHTFETLGASRVAAAQQQLMEYIEQAGPKGRTRASLMLRFLKDMEPHVFTQVLDELAYRSQVVNRVDTPTGPVYKWTGEARQK